MWYNIVMNEENNPKAIGKNSGILQDPKTGRFVVGNPGGGRPKGSVSITGEIRRKLQQASESGRTYLDLVIDKIIDKAIKDGDTATLRIMWSYIDGMPKQSTDITSGGKPIFIPSELMKKHGITSDSEDNSE